MGNICGKKEKSQAKREIEEQQIREYGKMPEHIMSASVTGHSVPTKEFQAYVQNLQEVNSKRKGVGTTKTREEFKANLLRLFTEEEAERMTMEEYGSIDNQK